MKKLIAFLLAAACVCGCLVGCNKADPDAALYDENMPNKLLNSQVEDFPLASDSTTYAQRRQMCVDFFRLMLDFQWKTNIDVEDYVSYYFGYTKGLLKDNLYEGIPYGGTSTGNLYRWMEYYDQTTGIMDLETAFKENGGWGEDGYVDYMKETERGAFPRYSAMMALFNQCSSAPGWAWARVINSCQFGMTKDTNAYNGYIPVGCYSYGYEHEGKTIDMTQIDVFGEKTEKNLGGYDVPDVIRDMTKENKNALFDCYAQMKPGDCLVNTGHQLMVTAVNLYTSKDGTVDYSLSTVTVMEQIDGWGKKDNFNGTPLFQQGWNNHSYMFEQLQEENYIPFTFEELLDPNDAQDKKHLDYFASYKDKLVGVEERYSAIDFTQEMNGSGIEPAQVYTTLDRTEGSISYAEFAGMSVASNYSISDVFVTITDKDGNQLLQNIYRVLSCYTEREVAMTGVRSLHDTDENGELKTMCEGVEALANGENTIEITVQTGHGEKLTAFKGTLTAK